MNFIMQDFVGRTFHTVARKDFDGNEGVIFKSEDQSYMLVHKQDCCEQVGLEDVVGDLSDLENSEIIKAEERSDVTNDESGESLYWTFYEIATNKGSVTLRFYAYDSYYSVKIHLIKLLK